ncbi:MAG: DNA-deoxyinosine glycosylase [Lentisphaeria bacterium]|nr:DNA-deoxyinosine glycosylase [Lentisphaeria bacterium]
MAKQKSFPYSADENARILVLGSMPGAESLRQHQYYAFKHNAFWRIMGEVYGFSPELPYPERLAELRKCGVALWDVLAECVRPGSLDSDIRSPCPNDIPALVAKLPKLEKILCNGGASRNYLRRFFPELEAQQLPSTSPAAARFTYAQKLAVWRAALGR